MNWINSLLALFFLAHTAQASASAYQPTILESPEQVSQIFSRMPEGFKEEGGFRSESQCFQRAEIWSYDFHRNQKIEAMKVFIFYTQAFRSAYFKATGYPFDWWFHVSPYVLAKNPTTGKTEEWVMDKTYLDRPTDIGTWSNLFATLHLRCDEDHENCTMKRFADDKPCAENVPIEKFMPEVRKDNPVYGNEFCYIVRTPAPVYQPADIETAEASANPAYEWDEGQILASLKNATTGKRRSYFYQLLGF